MTERTAASVLDFDRLRQLDRFGSVRLVRRTGSTNSDALAGPLPPLPALLVAERQTGGRGRGGHRWHSRAGDLTFSITLAPRPVEQTGRVALTSGLAVAGVCERFGCRFVGLKWPNDVVVWDAGRLRKLAGVLVETRPDRVVVGVGVNGPPIAADHPDRTSVADETGRDIDPTTLLAAIVSEIVELATAEQPTPLRDNIQRRNVLFGRRITSGLGDGIAGAVQYDGSLELLTDAGEAVRIRSGSVRLLPTG